MVFVSRCLRCILDEARPNRNTREELLNIAEIKAIITFIIGRVEQDSRPGNQKNPYDAQHSAGARKQRGEKIAPG